MKVTIGWPQVLCFFLGLSYLTPPFTSSAPTPQRLGQCLRSVIGSVAVSRLALEEVIGSAARLSNRALFLLTTQISAHVAQCSREDWRSREERSPVGELYLVENDKFILHRMEQ